MIALFLGLTLVNLAALAWACASGFTSAGPHSMVGVSSAVLCAAVHCVVITYFTATGKWIEHVIAVYHLDAAPMEEVRRLKRRILWPALLAPAGVFVAAVLGVAIYSYGLAPRWHVGAGLLATALNLWGAVVEYRNIARNGALMNEILATTPTAK